MKSSFRLAIALRPALRASTLRPTLAPLLRPFSQPLQIHKQRQPFSYTHTPRKGLQPDSEDPKPPATEDHVGHHALEPAQIADSEYHELADQYIDALVLTLEEMAEDAKNGVEVEYSVRVPLLQ
jgi:frataxin